MHRALPLTLLALLAACGTPQERCIQSATREVRTVANLISEVEGNIARGYAYETYEVTRTVWKACDVVRPRDGAPPQVRYCLDDETDTLRRRVAIDPQSEARKLDGLRARARERNRTASAQVGACKRQYPE